MLKEAVGVLSDKFGFWYILDFTFTRNNISFLIVNENSGERHRFKLAKREGEHEFIGTTRSLHLYPIERREVNCLALETPEITPNMTGIPERMLTAPAPDSLH